MRSRILSILITLFFAFSASANSSTIDSLLRVLDNTIQQGAYFQQIREDRIQGIKDLYKKIEIDNEQQYFFIPEFSMNTGPISLIQPFIISI